jgi:ABC-type tungstate transport system permease subunit
MVSKRSRSRRLLRGVGVGLPVVAATILALVGVSAAAGVGSSGAASKQSNVRLLTVGAARTGGMLDQIVSGFEKESGYDVTVSTAGQDIFDRARAGEADIVMAHLGFTELQEFVGEGTGLWPATVLSNTVALLIPPDDPAGVRPAGDPFEAFKLIAEHESPFVVNNLGETLYITNTLWNAAGRPDKGDWFIDLGQSGPPAVREAESRGGYTIWGLHPFLTLQQQDPVHLDPVVFNDALMQRIIATVVVKRPSDVNRKGALALQRYLTDPATQAQIRSFRLPHIDQPAFWPAGNQNDN